MMSSGKSRKRKKIKYYELRLKLSARQRRSLLNYCRARKTTPTTLIKKVMRPYISGFAAEVPEEYYATENQLDLFDDNGIE